MDKIDIRDLRVDDWVMVYPWDETPWGPKKITGISFHSWKGTYFCSSVGVEECGEFPLDQIKPIPLTKEILEKNGFEEDGEGVYGDDNSFFIPTYQNGFDTGTWEAHIEPTEGIGDFSGKLRYVHQLQNILRDAGIEKEITI